MIVYKYKADELFSIYVRLRDADEFGRCRCISCGKIGKWREFDCGHYIPRSNMATRYDERNCNAQCQFCNRSLHGNLDAYRAALVSKYGEGAVERLEWSRSQTVKLTDDDFKRLVLDLKIKIRNLKNEKGI